jgi:hypothetical protein
MVISGLILPHLPGPFQSETETFRTQKNINFSRKAGFSLKLKPQLIGERQPSCYHRWYFSREFHQKVTQTIFTNEIKGQSALDPARCQIENQLITLASSLCNWLGADQWRRYIG